LNKQSSPKTKSAKPSKWTVAFLALVLLTYLVLFLIMPDRATLALKSSTSVFRSIALPLTLAFVIMMALNIFVKPPQIVKFLGRSAGGKGTAISMIAGIISAGPIYAWYPMLKDLKEKGASNSPIAIFLYNRAVKLFLLPMMIAYFLWEYVLILTVLMVLGSVTHGYLMNIIVKEESA